MIIQSMDRANKEEIENVKLQVKDKIDGKSNNLDNLGLEEEKNELLQFVKELKKDHNDLNEKFDIEKGNQNNLEFL